MVVTEEILQKRIAGLIIARDAAAKNDDTKPVVPMIEAQITKSKAQLKALQGAAESEKKNDLSGQSVTSESKSTEQQFALVAKDEKSLEEFANSDVVRFDDRDDSNIPFEYEELEKKNFNIIENYDEFDAKKKAIYRHIRDWVNRKTVPTESQKKKKREVMLVEFTNIINFVKQNTKYDYIQDVLETEYKISFGKIGRAKKGETPEEAQKRNARKKNTFTLNYDDMMKKYFS